MPDVGGEALLADAAGSGDGPMSRWVQAVRLGGQGRYAAAEALLRGLRTDRGVPPAVRAHAAVTRASHLRQVGAHGAAARLDAAAVLLAVPLVAGAGAGGDRGGAVPDPAGTGPAAAYGDALTGLAADAIGRWDAGTAGRLLDRAAPWCGVAAAPDAAAPDAAAPDAPGPDGPGPSRTAVRWFWVRAETALLAGDPVAAVRASGAAVRLAAGLGSPRHLLKSRLVDAVARGAAAPGERTAGEGSTRDPIVDELDAIAAGALDVGLLPLRWPALLAAADRELPVADPDAAAHPQGRHAGRSRLCTVSRQTVAHSRRHAAYVTLNAIYLRSDPVARKAMRESAWLPGPGAVPY